MTSAPASALLAPSLAEALEKKGYSTLTPVQLAVLDPALCDRDLRISSQTGSGKTLAIGFAVRDVATGKAKPAAGVARPRALVVTPTRELAKQVEAELDWLYAPSQVRVASVTGGASYRNEQRAFAQGPGIIVGTPGRLLDHLRRGSIDPENVGAVVLDEADRMLDLGFRDDLEAILDLAPEGHRTHLVSATFPREVKALADQVQDDPAHVQGTALGVANSDIDHVVHLVSPRERLNALVNLLLVDPDAQTLVFARTRADVARIADELHQAGFSVDSLSGEMDQEARNRALSAFKRGKLHALVATDVAARGIDHQDIARVVQMEPPTDADTYTHRSGRTGRAGRKGISSTMVAPAGISRLGALLKRAGVRYRVEPIPTARTISATQDQRLFVELTAEVEAPKEADTRATELARRLIEAGHAEKALARLIVATRRSGHSEARDVTPMQAAPAAGARTRNFPERTGRVAEGAERPRDARGEFVGFRVSWGEAQGADARRLLAMLCRRGNIRGADIGPIRVHPTFSVVGIAAGVAESFERATREPDPRDPRVSIQRDGFAQHVEPRKGPAPRFAAPRAAKYPTKKRHPARA